MRQNVRYCDKEGLGRRGTGNPWFKIDVGIVDGRIIKVGISIGDVVRVTDANGLILTLGFIYLPDH